MLVGKTHTMTEDDIIARRVADRLLDISLPEREVRDYIGAVGWRVVRDSPITSIGLALIIGEVERLSKLGVSTSRIRWELQKLKPH